MVFLHVQWQFFFYFVCGLLFFRNVIEIHISYQSVDLLGGILHSNSISNFFSNTNSEHWISSRKLKNNADPLLDPDAVHELILYDSPNNLMPLETTICSSDSRFMRKQRYLSPISEGDHEQQLFSDLAYRLLFLGIHHHQHQHARKEAVIRRVSNVNERIFEKFRNNSLHLTAPGIFDYECPNAKFLVSAVPGGTGLGHAIRKVALETIKAAMASNRVALFINSARFGPEETKSQWTMASCVRHDIQCFFMPLSPCTITEKDLQTASVLTMEESLSWGTSSHVLDKYNSSRVVVMKMHSKQTPTWSWQARINYVMDSILSFVDTVSDGLDDKSKKAYGFDSLSLELVKKFLEGAEKKDPWILDHAIIFYILRPNPTSKRKMKDIMQTVFPSNFDPASAIGLPIRSSDKCNRESECLTFDHYMQIVQQFSPKDNNLSSWPMNAKQRRHIILTTESIEMLQARHKYNRNQSFPFYLIANDQDVAQGTGNPRYYKDFLSRNVTADDIMLSTMTSLNMQLMAASTVGNCCSNFHKLMLEFLSRGCGAAPSNNFECLQENKNPRFRLCCQWSNNQECRNKRGG